MALSRSTFSQYAPGTDYHDQSDHSLRVIAPFLCSNEYDCSSIFIAEAQWSYLVTQEATCYIPLGVSELGLPYSNPEVSHTQLGKAEQDESPIAI